MKDEARVMQTIALVSVERCERYVVQVQHKPFPRPL